MKRDLFTFRVMPSFLITSKHLKINFPTSSSRGIMNPGRALATLVPFRSGPAYSLCQPVFFACVLLLNPGNFLSVYLVSLLIKQFSTTSPKLLAIARIAECMGTVRDGNHCTQLSSIWNVSAKLVSYQRVITCAGQEGWPKTPRTFILNFIYLFFCFLKKSVVQLFF